MEIFPLIAALMMGRLKEILLIIYFVFI